MPDGSDPGSDLPLTPVTLLAILGAGFAVGALGHLIRSRVLILIGVVLVFAATALLPIAYRL